MFILVTYLNLALKSNKRMIVRCKNETASLSASLHNRGNFTKMQEVSPRNKNTVHGASKIKNFVDNQRTVGAMVLPSLRLIVLTMNRASSLLRLLNSLKHADYLGDKVALDIWIDVDAKNKLPHKSTLQTANDFIWPFGPKTVHVREEQAGLRRQWIDTWDLSIPGGLHANTRERALILEDDLNVSPIFWLWLKTAQDFYADYANVAGFTLQRASLCAESCPKLEGGPVPDNTNFFYPLVGSWGYSPRAAHWVKFMQWEKQYQHREKIEKPYVPNTTPTKWYKDFEKSGRCPGKKCMWTQLHHYYTWLHEDKFTLYYRASNGKTLCKNHQERGLHFDGNSRDFGTDDLVTWSPKWVPSFSHNPPYVMLNGKVNSDTDRCTDQNFLEVAKCMYRKITKNTGETGVSGKNPFLIVIMANKAFLPFIYSWLCNTAHMPRVHEQTLFIFSDNGHETLTKSQFVVNTVQIDTKIDKGLELKQDYGSLGYWLLVHIRVKTIIKIIQANIPFLLCEPDAVWVRNPLQDPALHTNADIIGFDDGGIPGFGFIRISPTPNVKDLFFEMEQKFKKQIPNNLKNFESGISVQGEQAILHTLIQKRTQKSYKNLTFEMLPNYDYVSGRWYDGGVRQDSAEVRAYVRQHGVPYVINNNWIIGNENKIKRAKRWGHWFLQDFSNAKSSHVQTCVDDNILTRAIEKMRINVA